MLAKEVEEGILTLLVTVCAVFFMVALPLLLTGSLVYSASVSSELHHKERNSVA